MWPCLLQPGWGCFSVPLAHTLARLPTQFLLFSCQGPHAPAWGSGHLVPAKARVPMAHLQNALDALALGVLPVLTVQQPVWVADELHEALGLGATQHWVLQVIAVLTQRLKAAFSYPFLRKLLIRGLGPPGRGSGVREMGRGPLRDTVCRREVAQPR